MLTRAELADRVGRRRLRVAANCSDAELDAVLDGLPAGASDDLTGRVADAASRIDTAIGDAVAEVASAVAQRYAVSTVTAAPMLKRLAADRALFHLHADVVPEDLEERRDHSLKLLAALRAGKRLVTDAAGSPYPRIGGPQVSAPEPILTGADGALAGY